MRTTTLCESCYEPCSTIPDDGEFDAHGPGGIVTVSRPEIEISDCCGETVKEVDTDLVEWHGDLTKLAKEDGLEWVVNCDPECHSDLWEEGLSDIEALENLKDLWDV
jgi:hypothetical protein